MSSARVGRGGSLAAILLRGCRKRCPRCGRGSLFERWTRMRGRCPACDLRYLEDRGDPWAFLMVILSVVVLIAAYALWFWFLGWLLYIMFIK